MALWLVLAILPYIAPRCRCSDNLVSNPSFEEGTSHWLLKRRQSYWALEDAEDAAARVVHTEYGHVLLFQEGSGALAFFASQYIPQTSIKDSFGLLQLSFITNATGIFGSTFKIYLDISYIDGSYIKIREPIGSMGKNLKEKCLTLPNYGSIRSIMITFMAEGSLKYDVTVDDVTLKFTDNPSSHCHIYTDSFPTKRHVIHNFLASKFKEETGNTVTLATQLTTDRLPYLNEMAKKWQGPISTAILIFNSRRRDSIATLINTYYKNDYLKRYASLHVVYEDNLNNDDEKMYPVNFLRNIAISAVKTKYIFYIDADILPGFSCLEASRNVQKAVTDHEDQPYCSNGKCAFIAPLFNAKTKLPTLPDTKDQLKDFLDDGRLEAYLVVSHKVVHYPKWYTSNNAYSVNYREDMEPYFIVSSKAPMMSELFIGYGRDKCAYSRELNSAGFRFVVLPDAFLINNPDPPGGSSIYQRSAGLQTHVFVTSLFHQYDLNAGFFRYRSVPQNVETEYCHSLTSADTSSQSGHCSRIVFTDEDHIQIPQDSYSQRNGDDGGSNDNENSRATFQDVDANRGLPTDIKYSTEYAKQTTKEEVQKPRAQVPSQQDKPADSDLNDIHDIAGSSACEGKVHMEHTKNLFSHLPSPLGEDIILENLFQEYETRFFIYLPGEVTGRLNLMLPSMHPDAVISLMPSPGPVVHTVRRLFEIYKGGNGDVGVLVKEVLNRRQGRITWWIDSSFDNLVDFDSILKAVTSLSADNDVIVLKVDPVLLDTIEQNLCRYHTGWGIYKQDDFFIVKSKMITAPQIKHPKLPFESSENVKSILDECKGTSTVDIVLITKNRPLQTLAFLESLSEKVTGFNKIWILQKCSEDIIKRGYKMVTGCFPDFDIQVVHDSGEFEHDFKEILLTSQADFVIMAVDEIVWIDAVDLARITCFWELPGFDPAAFHFRLGKNINVYDGISAKESRFHVISELDHVIAFKPMYMPYDFGYALHLDGIMVRRDSVLVDLEGSFKNCRSPGVLEAIWIRQAIHYRCRQWHLMYNESHLVNNNIKLDGRVANAAAPSAGSLSLAKLLVEEKQKIDIKSFTEHNKLPDATHVKRPIKYVYHTCTP